jgi:hypothetical protein
MKARIWNLYETAVHTLIFLTVPYAYSFFNTTNVPSVVKFYPNQGDRPDDGGSKYLWKVCKLLQDYTVLQPRRQPSSYSPPWEPQIVLRGILLLLRWDDICLCGTGPLSIPQMSEYEATELTGENRRTRRKTCPSATLTTTNPTLTDRGENPGLRGEKPATNRLSYDTANKKQYENSKGVKSANFVVIKLGHHCQSIC